MIYLTLLKSRGFRASSGWPLKHFKVGPTTGISVAVLSPPYKLTYKQKNPKPRIFQTLKRIICRVHEGKESRKGSQCHTLLFQLLSLSLSLSLFQISSSSFLPIFLTFFFPRDLKSPLLLSSPKPWKCLFLLERNPWATVTCEMISDAKALAPKPWAPSMH